MIAEATVQQIKPARLLSVLTTSHLINDFYVVLFPFLVPTLTERFDLSYFGAGLLAITVTFIPGLMQPVMGLLADRFSWRKRVIMLGDVLVCVWPIHSCAIDDCGVVGRRIIDLRVG